MAASTSISIEKLGGLAGFGMPGSPLRSQGTVDVSTLSPQEKEKIDGLFTQEPAPSQADGFRYRITRKNQGGEQTVEVPEHLVPDSILAAVHDEMV